MLYRPDRHEPLTERAWDEAWAGDVTARVVDEPVAAWDVDEFWPAHEWDAAVEGFLLRRGGSHVGRSPGSEQTSTPRRPPFACSRFPRVLDDWGTSAFSAV